MKRDSNKGYGLLVTSVILFFAPFILEILKYNGVLKGGPIEERQVVYTIMVFIGILGMIAWLASCITNENSRKKILQ